MKENDQRPLYLTQKIQNIAYNTKYNILKFFQQYNKTQFATPDDIIYILGQKFVVTPENINQVQQKVYQIFQTTPWLTYRSGFPQLPNQIVGSYVSDTGWGCMVRVGQMLFSQVLKKHRNLKERADILKIISLFSDYDKSQPFSIHKIARLARIQYGLKPGQWYNPSQISFILSQLHRQALAQSMKLRFCVFHSGNLFFDTLAQSMLDQKPKCSCKKAPEFLLCTNCNKQKFATAVIVLSRIGLGSPQKKYLNVLQRLMESQFCQGVIGGKPKKALYFVGKQNDHFIYLDPHYVHSAQNKTEISQTTYFCQSFRKCKNTSIDSSIGICYYLRTIADLNKFHKEINQMRTENYEDFFIFVSDVTPSYIKQTPLKSIQLDLMKDQTFEMI